MNDRCDNPCPGCPWTSVAERDREALTAEVRLAAAGGAWFACHVRMGTCHGAARYATSGAAAKLREAWS